MNNPVILFGGLAKRFIGGQDKASSYSVAIESEPCSVPALQGREH